MLLFAGNREILTQGFISKDTILNALARLEETGFSTLLRESGVAFFTALTLHSLAMAFVVGINLLLALRLLGSLREVSLPSFRPYLTLHWWFALLIFLSGAALLLAYPAKALTNPVFYVKLFALSCGLLITAKVHRDLLSTAWPSRAPSFGAAMVCCWLITIFTGRFLAYTNSILLASSFY